MSGLRAELKKLEDRAGGDPLAPPYRVRHARILKSIERRTKRLNEVKAAAGLC
ncbi:MAG: hypothetical protein ACRDZ7_00205 [Acidimicrobiia bacterium]